MPKQARDSTRILVVDDNPAVLKLLGSLFEERGTSVTLAESVPQARAALDAAKWNFDLVLSDIAMPGETGFDLLRWIKREGSPNRDLPVLLTTAQLPEAENRVKGLSMGAVDYVVRPIELSELVIRAGHAIENFKRVRSLETSLQDSEGLAVVGRLLAASHHEIKNLAGLVSLATEQTVKCFGKVADERGAIALRSLTQTSELLADVSRNVTGLLEPGAATTKATDLCVLARDVVDLIQARVKPCRVEAKCNEPAVWAEAHAVRVKQVLINLILNANDAIQELDSAAGGTIRVTVTSSGGWSRLSVLDNGMGFDGPAERTEFKAFATTKKMRGGQGLGLWLCATLVRNMGGRLSLNSKGIGLGAEAVMLLPEAAAPSAEDELDISEYLADLDDV